MPMAFRDGNETLRDRERDLSKRLVEYEGKRE